MWGSGRYEQRILAVLADIHRSGVKVQGAHNWEENVVMFLEQAVKKELDRMEQDEEEDNE